MENEHFKISRHGTKDTQKVSLEKASENIKHHIYNIFFAPGEKFVKYIISFRIASYSRMKKKLKRSERF